MRTVFLVNPISGRGHLDAYARLYARALVELGYRVVLLAGADGDTTDYLARNDPALASSFSFVSFSQVRRPLTGSMAALLNRILRALGRRLLRTRLARALGLPLSYGDANRIRFNDLLRYIDTIASMPGQAKPDLVLFQYLDLMAEQPRNVAVLDCPGAAPWAGILFHPRLAQDAQAPIEGYFGSCNARGGVFLVPSAIPAYAKATPHLHFALAPDVADLELPREISELARNMRTHAGDRTIVLQIGSITAHKGIPTLLDVIAAADPNRFFFALIGEVHWESFGGHTSRVRSFYARPPENVFLSQGYIESERDYNDIIRTSDIIYAVYQGFGSSSNSLTKAAGFRRPILVAENSLMGDRVRSFNTGAAVREGDANAILAKLNWLATQPKESFGFETFAGEQSLEALKRVLNEALPAWLAKPLAEISEEPHGHEENA